jgi:hypothetical protein
MGHGSCEAASIRSLARSRRRKSSGCWPAFAAAGGEEGFLADLGDNLDDAFRIARLLCKLNEPFHFLAH